MTNRRLCGASERRALIDVLPAPYAVAQSASVPRISVDWIAAPLEEREYRHFTRRVANGPDDTLTATLQVCDCQPGRLFDELAATLRKIPTAVITRDAVSACDRTVQHMVVSGLSDGVSRKNMDIYAMRTANALVYISYDFTKAAPSPEDESSMQALCPRTATPS